MTATESVVTNSGSPKRARESWCSVRLMSLVNSASARDGVHERGRVS